MYAVPVLTYRFSNIYARPMSVMPDFMLQLLYMFPCPVWGSKVFMSRLAVVITLPRIHLEIRDCLF